MNASKNTIMYDNQAYRLAQESEFMDTLVGVTPTEVYPDYTRQSTANYTCDNINDYDRFIPNSISKVTKDSFSTGDNSNVTKTELYYSSSNDFLDVMELRQATPSAHYFNAYYDYIQLDDTTDVDSNNRHHLITQPFRLIRGVLNQHVLDILQLDKFITTKLTKPLFLNTKFSPSGEMLKDKELLPETLWGFRQKKYKKVKKFKFKPEVIYDPVTFKVIGHKPLPTSPKVDIAGVDLRNTTVSVRSKVEQSDLTNKIKEKPEEDNFNYRISAKISRHRSELVPVTLARRLLRTKRTLVLPAHVNLTLITNSYDVVHS